MNRKASVAELILLDSYSRLDEVNIRKVVPLCQANLTIMGGRNQGGEKSDTGNGLKSQGTRVLYSG